MATSAEVELFLGDELNDFRLFLLQRFLSFIDSHSMNSKLSIQNIIYYPPGWEGFSR